jgi:hypothetical protein
MNTEIRELTDQELDLASGGVDLWGGLQTIVGAAVGVAVGLSKCAVAIINGKNP